MDDSSSERDARQHGVDRPWDRVADRLFHGFADHVREGAAEEVEEDADRQWKQTEIYLNIDVVHRQVVLEHGRLVDVQLD